MIENQEWTTVLVGLRKDKKTTTFRHGLILRSPGITHEIALIRNLCLSVAAPAGRREGQDDTPLENPLNGAAAMRNVYTKIGFISYLFDDFMLSNRGST